VNRLTGITIVRGEAEWMDKLIEAILILAEKAKVADSDK
jgi:hypothetical protein